MLINGLRRLLTLCVFVTATAVVANGCSSSSSSTGIPSDAAADSPGITPIHRGDAAPPGTIDDSGGSGDSATAGLFDGTVGLPCQTNADCRPAGGPKINVCSLGAFTGGPLFPTPVCILQSCDPGTDGFLHYCDGPDVPASPGICLKSGTGGICFPRCDMLADGAAPAGCRGKDACNFIASGLTTTSQLVGLGYCFGGCTSDTDCPSNSGEAGAGKCQTDQGLCVTAVQQPTKAPGDACGAADARSGACNCYYSTAASAGYCAPACIVGSTTSACPAGFVCDSQQPAALRGDAGATGFTKQNVGLAGYCLAACGGTDAGSAPAVVDAGSAMETGASDAEAGTSEGGVDASGGTAEGGSVGGWHPGLACPGGTVCMTDPAGPACLLQ
ncbi:MAG: hypothetical protein M3O36_01885 [Myxococcota bacterium]|nr:hypothetical protein [Myxococcota bacterium]